MKSADAEVVRAEQAAEKAVERSSHDAKAVLERVSALSRNFDHFEQNLSHFELILYDFDRFRTFLSKAIAHSGP